MRLHEALVAPAFHLLLCGPTADWPDDRLSAMRERYGAFLAIHRLTREPGRGILLDPSGKALAALGGGRPAQYLIRPDGHVGYRAGGTDLTGLSAYLTRWLTPP